MLYRNNLLLALILIVAFLGGAILVWQGLNLDIKSLPTVNKTANNQFESPTSSGSAEVKGVNSNTYKVVKVIDGDTFHIDVNGEEVSVRMIGIDTPETVDPRRPVGCFGKAASDETKRLLEGKNVTLTKDITDTDKYNRLLRYVFLPISGSDNLFINDYLVRQGFAKAYTYPPDVKYDSRFVAAEQEARENLRGLWNECK